MNIKLLILLKDIDGGTGTYLDGLLDLKKRFKNGELTIKVLVLNRPKFRRVKTNRYYFLNDARLYRHNYSFGLGNIWLITKELWWFKKNIKGFVPDIVLGSNFHSIIISEAAKSLFRLKYKTVNIVQNNPTKVVEHKLPKNLKNLTEALLSFFLDRSNKVVTVSKHLSRDLFNNFHLEVLPSTIPVILPKLFTANNINTKRFENKIIVSVARLDSQKDHETLLKAFKLVNNEIPQTKLWIVGDGPEKEKLILLTNKLGIKNSVRFLGWIQNPVKILCKSSLFVLSSHWEGFPLSLIEAMNCSLPVVASNCKYGPSEILENNKYGLLAEPNNVSSLAASIVEILSDKVRFNHFSQMAKKRVFDYPREEMILKYKKIITQLASS